MQGNPRILRRLRERTYARRLAGAAAALVLATGAAEVAYAAYGALAGNDANTITTGSVDLGDNDSGQAMLALDSAALGATDVSCIRLNYSGTLEADVRHFADVSGALAPYLTLKITRGSGASTFDSCTGFEPDVSDHSGAGPGVIYEGPLSSFPTTYETAVTDPASASSAEVWTTAEAHDYKFEIALATDSAAAGKSASATFRWEARSR